MEFINHITDALELEKVISSLTDGQSGTFDLAVLFISPYHPYKLQTIIDGIKKKLSIRNFISVTCAGIIGTEKEIEYKPSASLMLAKLPGVKVTPFYLTQDKMELMQEDKDWYEYFETFPNEKPHFLVFPDPFLIDANYFLSAVNKFYPGSVVAGGLASAASQPKENILYLNGQYYQEGLMGVVLTGNIEVDTVVSQGCRPIGETYIVTKAEGNVIYELAGRKFYQVLEEVLQAATVRDRLLAQEAVFVGIAMNEYTHQFKRGDFIIRGLLGVDTQSGAGAIADYIHAGQTVQFHLRDAQTAQEDLNALLTAGQERIGRSKPRGAFVFSCNGRGENLFRVKDHDIKIIQNYLGNIPAAGFFCAGEIGPVGGTNFLHGFTSSMALFYPKS